MEKFLEIQFEQYYREYSNKVYRYFYYKINNREEAEDLTQETFVYCYKNFEGYDPQKSSFSTWVYLVANCRLKNFYRDKKITVDYDSLEGVLSEDNIGAAEQAMYLQQLRGEIAGALEKLPENYRQVIIKKYFQQKDHQQIAREMGITAANSRVLLTRAIKKLSDGLRYIKEEEN